MVVGKVGRRSPRSLCNFLDSRRQNRIVRLNGDGEPAVRLRIFMATVDLGLARKGGKLHERTPHHRVGCFEDPAATEREKRVAAESDLVFLEIIGDVSERMSGGLDDLGGARSDTRIFPLLHLMIEERDSRRVLGRPPYSQAWEFHLQFRNPLDVIGVMMGDQHVR